MEKTQYLPLGSVVVLKGGVQKVVIVARGMVVKITDTPMFFEYGGALYPQGITNDSIMYFNHEDVQKVIYEGYKDEDDSLMCDNINEWFEQSPFEKGNPRKIKAENMGDSNG